MKVLVVGLGSMGKRRIRNLIELQTEEILGFDIREDRRQEASSLYPIKIFDDFQQALKQNPDAMIISTSPDKHLKYALIASENQIHFFTEVNTMNPEEMQQIIDSVKKQRVIGQPSSNVMFHPSIVKIKGLLQNGEIGKPLTFNFHSGSYLPGWHPWEKINEYYVYKKETGGGRDQIMWELSWIYQLIGKPETITALVEKMGDYDADIFDVYDLLIKFENKTIGHIMVDVIQQPPTRFCQIIGEKGTILWDYQNKMVRLFSTEIGKWLEFPEDVDYKGYTLEKPKQGFAIKDQGMTESYVDEVKNFLDITKGEKKQTFTFEDEKILLQTMYLAEKSSQNKVHVKL